MVLLLTSTTLTSNRYTLRVPAKTHSKIVIDDEKFTFFLGVGREKFSNFEQGDISNWELTDL